MSPVLSRTGSGYSDIVFPSVLWDRWTPTAKVPCPQKMRVGVLVRLLTHTGWCSACAMCFDELRPV